MEFEKEVKELQRQLDAQRQWLTVISSHVEELQPLKKLSKYVSDCDKARFDANEVINKRLTELESCTPRFNKSLSDMMQFIQDEFRVQGTYIGDLESDMQQLKDHVIKPINEKLANIYMTFIEMQKQLKNLHIGNATLHEHKNFQIDENRLISKRVDDLEKKFQDIWMNNLPSKILSIAERLQVLECVNKPSLMTTNPDICLHCQKDVNELAGEATKRLMDEFIEYTKGKVEDL
jgi:uncharacterized coiled-coil protein SlyX